MQFPEVMHDEHEYMANEPSTFYQDYLECDEVLNTQSLESNQQKKIVCALLKSSDEYGLSKTTKFLARQYCVRFLTRFPSYLWTHTQLLMISSLRLAVKFNQNVQISTSYTLDCCVSQSQNQYSHQDFIEFELVLLSALQFHLKIQSPYEYLDEYGQILSLQPIQKTLIETAIDFMLSLVQYPNVCGEQIFGSCLAAIYEQRKIQNYKVFRHLSTLSRRYIDMEEKAKQVKESIFNMDQEILESPQFNY